MMTEIISVQGLPFLACLVMLAILGYIGIHVLKREVIFIDIALAQIAAVGTIAAHVVFHFHDQAVYAHALSLGGTLVAAAFFAVVRRRIVEIPLEAVIGVSYAVSAAAALFLVGVAPGGHVHVQEMLAGSILWATWHDILWSAVVFAAVGLCFFVFRRPFRAISEDYETAVEAGYNTVAWDFLFYALVGVVITAAVRTAGVVVVFTLLIIPATLSAAFASGWGARLVIAWMGGAVSAALGLLFAERFDFSVGPAIGLYLGATLIMVGLLRLARLATSATAVVSLIITVVFGVWLVTGTRVSAPAAGRSTHAGSVPAKGTGAHSNPRTHAHDHDDHPLGAGDETGEARGIDEETLSEVGDATRLASLFYEAADVEERSSVVVRLLEVDKPRGVRLALEFLGEDPPLLFRVTVVDKLESVLGKAVNYNVDEPFGSASNQAAVDGLKKSAGLE